MFDLVTAIQTQRRLRETGGSPLPARCQAPGNGPANTPLPTMAPVSANVILPDPQPMPVTQRDSLTDDVLFVDVETYHARDYSLQTLSLTEYLHDPRFQIHGIGVSFRGQQHWLSEADFRARARQTPWRQLKVAAHNAAFDAAVLAWRFGVQPAAWIDTLAMARGTHPQLPDYSLGALAQRFGLGEKGDALAQLVGIVTLSPAQQEALRRYNATDLSLLEALYRQLIVGYPEAELDLIDRTVRMVTEPCLVIDTAVIAATQAKLTQQRAAELAHAGVSLTDLRSPQRFAEQLTALGVGVPTKVSAKTGVAMPALSIKDADFLALKNHPDERVRTLVRARISAMSRLEETRAEKLLALAGCGPLPVELNYYGAATGRFSGGGGINLQNLPRESALRSALCAPEGHRLVGCDSAQIEARILAWLAGEQDLLATFRAGRDVYCEFASVFFGRPITQEDTLERQLGKQAILGLGYGMGAAKFADNLRAGGIALDAIEVKRLVDTYRQTYAGIPALWRAAETAIRGSGRRFGTLGLRFADARIALPNGLSLHYPELRIESDGQWRYAGRRSRETLYGGKIVENVVQALARIVVMAQQQTVARHYRVVFSVHDEIVCCVPEDQAEACREHLATVMATAPTWAPDLPLACKAAVGRHYGEL